MPATERHVGTSFLLFTTKECVVSNAEETTIPVARYLELVAAEEKLSALESAGVDNWEGYDHAMDILNGTEE